MMRRIILLFMAMAMTLVVASGVALAANKIGTDGRDTLWGTNGADNLFGLGGNDKLYALRGSDNLLGGPGSDFVVGGTREGGLGTEYPVGGNKTLFGGRGNDTFSVAKARTTFLGEQVTTSYSMRGFSSGVTCAARPETTSLGVRARTR
jgi:Ca2+-binding RTX toxin-like protein